MSGTTPRLRDARPTTTRSPVSGTTASNDDVGVSRSSGDCSADHSWSELTSTAQAVGSLSAASGRTAGRVTRGSVMESSGRGADPMRTARSGTCSWTTFGCAASIRARASEPSSGSPALGRTSTSPRFSVRCRSTSDRNVGACSSSFPVVTATGTTPGWLSTAHSPSASDRAASSRISRQAVSP